jgi:hypothetical protein
MSWRGPFCRPAPGGLDTRAYRLDRQHDIAVFEVWNGCSAHRTLSSAAPGSRLAFTYGREDFIDGIDLYGAPGLYRRFRRRQQPAA